MASMENPESSLSDRRKPEGSAVRADTDRTRGSVSSVLQTRGSLASIGRAGGSVASAVKLNKQVGF